MSDIDQLELSPWQWWQSRRKTYNLALIAAGTLAFIVHAVISEAFIDLLPLYMEITAFTILFQGILYLLAMGLANILYCLGPLTEMMVRPRNPAGFRRRLYRLGLWFSVALPFSVPVATAAQVLGVLP